VDHAPDLLTTRHVLVPLLLRIGRPQVRISNLESRNPKSEKIETEKPNIQVEPTPPDLRSCHLTLGFVSDLEDVRTL
jgi:hypothetical protein